MEKMCEVEDKKIKAVEERLRINEKEYLTTKNHDLICKDNTSTLKLHINEVIGNQRKDLDIKFDQMFKRLDDIVRGLK